MVKPGTIHLKESNRHGDPLWDVVICADCLTVHQRDVAVRKGDTRALRPWMGEARPCSWCDDSENAPGFELGGDHAG